MTTAPRSGHVHVAELRLRDEQDEAAPGAAITVALCGSWEHDGPCRWPHHTATATLDGRTTVRTVFVCPPQEEPDVRARIAAALRAAEPDRWEVVAASALPPDRGDEALIARLAATPAP